MAQHPIGLHIPFFGFEGDAQPNIFDKVGGSGAVAHRYDLFTVYFFIIQYKFWQ